VGGNQEKSGDFFGLKMEKRAGQMKTRGPMCRKCNQFYTKISLYFIDHYKNLLKKISKLNKMGNHMYAGQHLG